MFSMFWSCFFVNMATIPTILASSFEERKVETLVGSVFVRHKESIVFIQAHGRYLRVFTDDMGELDAEWVTDVEKHTLAFSGRVEVPKDNTHQFVCDLYEHYQEFFNRSQCDQPYAFLSPKNFQKLDLSSLPAIGLQQLAGMDLIGMESHRDFWTTRTIEKGEFICAITPSTHDPCQGNIKVPSNMCNANKANCRLQVTVVDSPVSPCSKPVMAQIVATKQIKEGKKLYLPPNSDFIIKRIAG